MESKKKVLVVGDIMIDRYHYVTSERTAPEAPIPVWDHAITQNRLGGAGNVALNLWALGGGESIEVTLAGAMRMQDREMIPDAILMPIVHHMTMMKERYVSGRDIIFRVDNFKKFSPDTPEKVQEFIEFTCSNTTFDAVVVSDYDKGTIDSSFQKLLRKLAPIYVVDSKRKNLSMFNGCDVLKLNEKEFEIQDGFKVTSLTKNLVVTLGKDGAALKQLASGGLTLSTETFPVKPVEDVLDVTGCGDTHTAAMTFSLLNQLDIRKAIKFANECSRNVVQKFGTSVVSW
jgi:D-beta-D-heptose 7-phosphate kinase/D-beta-D-heptose 1-phosphate adenosyltransferase